MPSPVIREVLAGWPDQIAGSLLGGGTPGSVVDAPASRTATEDPGSARNGRMDLEERVIVVTGSSGIAAAGARDLSRAGARVFVIGRTQETVEQLVAEVAEAGGSVASAIADLTDEQATVDAFERCLAHYGRLDGLFAVAGGSGRRFGDGPLHELSLDAWDATFRLNGAPTMLAAREAVRAMLAGEPDRSGGRGSIVIVGSVLAHSPVPAMFGTAAYAAVKGAQISLVRMLAATYAPHGIRVNAVTPGLVATPMSLRAQEDEEIRAYASLKQPLAAGFLPADAVSQAGVFLLGDASRYVTGQCLDVDGGWSVTEARASASHRPEDV